MSSMLAAVRRAATNPARAEGEDPPTDEEEDDTTEAEGEDPPPEDDEDESATESETTTTTTTTAGATGGDAAFALLDHAEAGGREALAKKLARKVNAGSLTYGEAVELLASAPKAGPGGGVAALAAMDRHVKVPANQRGATGGKSAAVPQNAAGWKAEYAASETLQGEYPSGEAYASYKQGVKDGRIRILSKAG